MPSRRVWLLLLVALVARTVTIGWDAGLQAPHPDERQVANVTGELDGWFDEPKGERDHKGFYAYGTLHFQAVRLSASAVTLAAAVPCISGSASCRAVKIAASSVGMAGRYRTLLVAGRVFSMLATMLAILAGWWLARRAWGRRTAELAVLLAAFVPLDIQQAHFATVEAHHAAWVMLTLAACFWLAARASRLAAIGVGAAFGASLAVKATSLGLVLPVAAALVLVAVGRRWLVAVEAGATLVTSGLLAFWFFQPWAFAAGRPPLVGLAALAVVVLLVRGAARTGGAARLLLLGTAGVAAVAALAAAAGVFGARLGLGFNPEYLGGVGEQIAMVVGASDPAYVRVYRGTLPVLYSLRELLLWGVGPALLLAAVAGASWAAWTLVARWRRVLGGRWSEGAALLVIMLAWVVPMAVRLSTLQVKFLRYFEPLVVPAVLLAAWALARLPRRWRRPASRLAVGGTVLWGVSFLWAFAEPHPHLTAQRWLALVTAADDVVAFEHWDEHLTVPATARAELESYNLPDDDGKVDLWCAALAESDWVILTSNRVRKAVLDNPALFPRTGRLYRLLLAGETGFEPVTRVERSPRILGITRSVQTADESFVNYDLPRVVVLRKTGEVDADELARRVERPLPFLEELDAAELDREHVDPLPRVPPRPNATSQLVAVVVWLVVFAALGGSCWLLLLPVVRPWPDAGVALSLVTGWLAASWTTWFGCELGVWPVGPRTASAVVVAAVALAASVAWPRRAEIAALWHRRRRGIRLALAATGIVWVIFLAVRAGNPAIYWGEKPMDFSFLNAFLRADSWPTGEPWMAGMPLHYYYFGEVLAAFPILAAGVAPAVGYNLMCATIPALAAGLLAALGLALAGRVRPAAAILPPLVVILTGNLAWPWLLDLARGGRWFDLWWATSRVLPSPAIDEYPLWTALFADLHGHFIALPVMLAALLWGWLAVRRERSWQAAAALCGIATAVLVATNPWDLFVLVAALAVGTLAAPRPLRGFSRLAVAAAVSLVACLPFIVELVAGIGAGAGGRLLHLTRADFAPAWTVVRHFGQFLLPLIVLAAAVLRPLRCWYVVAPVAAAGIGIGMWIGSSGAALGLAVAVLFVAVAVKVGDRRGRLMWSLAALAMVAVAACERFTLIDRMNTLFKVYNGVWLLLAVALAGTVLLSAGWRRRLVVTVWLPLQLVAMANLPLGIAQAWLQPRVPDPGSPGPRPTLDGQAYLAAADPQTWFLVRALEGMARPDDTIAEAARIAYASYTRIAMHTGQPTVVGWPYHLEQRGQPRAEIEDRYKDLETLYAGSDPVARREVLDRYRVRWVAVADLERSTYEISDDDPLAGVPGVTAVASRDGAVLYRVLDRPAGTVAPLVRTRLPEGLTAVAALPVVSDTVVRSLAIDDRGSSAVLRDGSLVALDPGDGSLTVEADVPCEPVSVARRGGVVWLGCPSGAVWRRDDGRWRAIGTVPGAARLTVGDELWAWGESGLWRHAGGQRWSRSIDRPIVAAAARGAAVAVADGRAVWLELDGGGRRPVPPVAGVRSLAWQDTALWALTDRGVTSSGGALLPWRPAFPGLDRVAAITAWRDRLWLVLSDGSIAQNVMAQCRSPWQSASGESGLSQPRGVAVGVGGWIVVADTQNHRIRWYSDGGSCLDVFGVKGDLPGQFREPNDVSVAADGTVAVADTWNGRVQLLRPGGGVELVGSNLYGPRGVLWMRNGSLLVADTGNRKVLRFQPPEWRREEVYECAGPVVGLAEVDGLIAAAVPAAGVVDLIDPVDRSLRRSLQVPGWEHGIEQEGHLARTPAGGLLATAPQSGQIWLLDPSGVALPRLVASELAGVTGVVALSDGQFLASMTWGNRLVRLSVLE